MKTLKEIKNLYAQEQGYSDWENLQFDTLSEGEEMEDHMNEICIRAQKAALEKAAENVKMLAKDFNCDCGQTHSDWQTDRTSITNPENLIR